MTRLPDSRTSSMARNMCGAPSYSLISTWIFASRSFRANWNSSARRRPCSATIIDVLGHLRSKSSGAWMRLAAQCFPGQTEESRGPRYSFWKRSIRSMVNRGAFGLSPQASDSAVAVLSHTGTMSICDTTGRLASASFVLKYEDDFMRKASAA